MNKRLWIIGLVFLMVLSAVLATDVIVNPDSFTNPEYAFDGNDATASTKTGTGNPTDMSLGITFDELTVGKVRVKATHSAVSGTATKTVILQTYDGTTWTNKATLASSTGTASFDGNYSLNETVQGLRIRFTLTGATGANTLSLYTLEYQDYYDEYWVNGLEANYELNDSYYNVTNSILNSWYYLYNGTGFGKTFYHGTNDGSTLANNTGDRTKFGQYRSFDGSNDYISTPSNSEMKVGNGKWSISFWMKTSNTTQVRDIIVRQSSTDEAYTIIRHGFNSGNNNIIWAIYRTNDSNTVDTSRTGVGMTIEQDTWMMVTAVYTGTELKLYKNGVFANQGIVTGSPSGNSTAGWTFAKGTYSGGYWEGDLDEVKMWNRQLSDSEILEEYTANAPVNTDGITAYYSFNDDVSTTVLDQNHLAYRSDTKTGMNFDGANDYIDTTYHNDLSQSFSFSVWVKVAGDSKNEDILLQTGASHYINLRKNNANQLSMSLYNGSAGTQAYDIADINDGEWHHAVGVVNRQTNRALFYLDGELGSNGNVSLATGPITANYFQLGINSYTGFYYNGSVSELRFYNKSLSENEIKTLYNGLQNHTINAYSIVSNSSLSTFNVTSAYGNAQTSTTNAYLYFPYGDVTITTDKSGYYSTETNITVNDSSSRTVQVSLPDAQLNVTVWDAVNDDELGEYNLTITQSAYDYSQTTEVLTETTQLYLEAGLTYGYTVTSNGYATMTGTFTATTGTQILNITSYTTNSFNINLYDETNNALITGTNMTVLFISDAEAVGRTTTNGVIYQDLLTPGDYELRYYSTSIDDYKLRSAFYTLTQDSYNNITLYAFNETDPGVTLATITFEVRDEELQPVGGARVVVERYYIDENGFVSVFSQTTKSDGTAIGVFESVDAFYRYKVYYNDELKFSSSNSGVQFIGDDTITIYITTVTNLESVIESIKDTPTTLTFHVTASNAGYFELNYTNDNNYLICLKVFGALGSTSCQATSSGSIQKSITLTKNTTQTLQGQSLIYDASVGQYIVIDTVYYQFVFDNQLQASDELRNTAAFLVAFLMIGLAVLFYRYPIVGLIVQTIVLIVSVSIPIHIIDIMPVTLGYVASLVVTVIIIGSKRQ